MEQVRCCRDQWGMSMAQSKSGKTAKSRYTRKQTGEFRPVAPAMREGGFIRLRQGIFEHIASGKMTPIDFAVYVTLLKWANWRTGICMTNSISLASNWGNWSSTVDRKSDGEETMPNTKERSIQNSLLRLRKRGFINYPTGDGTRGSYPVLIDKFEPTLGMLVGWSLDAAATTDLENPVYRYVSSTPFWEAYGEKYTAQHMRSCADDEQSTVQPVSALLYGSSAANSSPNCTVRVPFQDVLEMTRHVQEESRSKQDDSSLSTFVDSLREESQPYQSSSSNWVEEDDDELV